MILFYLVGLIFFCFGLALLAEAYYFRAKSRRLEGHIIGYERKQSERGMMFQPVVRYADGERSFLFKEGVASSQLPYALGEAVEVLVWGELHSSARLKGSGRRLIGTVFALLGATALLVALYQAEVFSLQLAGALNALLFALGAVAVALKLGRSMREEKEVAFDYTPGESELIGYRPTPELLDEAEEIKPYSYSKNWHLVGLLIGAAMLSGGVYWANSTQSFIAHAGYASGVIVSSKSSRSSESITHSPVIAYLPEGERNELRFTSAVGSSHPSWEIGDSVGVYYNRQNPKDAMQDNGWLNYLPQGVLVFLGLFVALSSLRQYAKKRAEERS